MAKFKVYYTIQINEVATNIFEQNDFEVKVCSHNDEETYLKNFVEFQKYWNELVPHIPIYVPASYDFYPANLKNFDNDTLTGIRQSILYAYFE